MKYLSNDMDRASKMPESYMFTVKNTEALFKCEDYNDSSHVSLLSAHCQCSHPSGVEAETLRTRRVWVTDPRYMARKVRKFRTDKFDT